MVKRCMFCSVLMVLSGSFRAFADSGTTGDYHRWGVMPWGMGGMMFMIPLVFILAVCVVLAGLFIVRRVGNGGGKDRGTIGSEDPLEILKRRYARGEIDREQFQSMKRDLEDSTL